MKKFAFMALFLATACEYNDEAFKPRTLESFKAHVSLDSTLAEIIDQFGEPDNDVGSGIHIYVYKLDDSTQIFIGYADMVVYVKHMDEAGVLLKTVVGRS